MANEQFKQAYRSTFRFETPSSSRVTLKHSVGSLFNGIHHWHIPSHVIRSSWILNSFRRASDSLLPVLGQRSELPSSSGMIKRSMSDTMTWIQRNKFEQTIAQYELLMRHLKNYEKFRIEHPMSNKPRRQEIFSKQKSIFPRQTQSLARNAGRTFTEFMMNDLLSSMASTSEQQSNKRASFLFDNQRDDSPAIPKELETAPKEKPLIQRLFEGKKTAFNRAQTQLESSRIPDEMTNAYQIVQRKCLFPTEQLVYASKMIKIDRRGYKQHIRMLCLTSERVYMTTKKHPYVKEAILFGNILGITCSPRQDGFLCLHTKETEDDRGDWLFLLDYPCEFITHLFLTMKKNDNQDQFLKFSSKFKHIRRNLATLTDECPIEVRPGDALRLNCENFDLLIIYTP